MHISLVFVTLFGLLAHVSHVSAVACTADSDCTATDFTLATCTSNVCACATGKVATNEGCAEKMATPTISVGSYNNEVISGQTVDLSCDGDAHSGSTYKWFDSTDTEIAGVTSQSYTTSALSASTTFKCQIISSVTALSSDKSNAIALTVLAAGGSSDALPTITLQSSKVANTKTFTATCSNGPKGATIVMTADGFPMTPSGLEGTITQVADPTGKQITCKFASSSPLVTFANTATIAYPALASTVDSVSITSPGITANIAYTTSATLPILTCETSPGAAFLPSAPTYSWTGTPTAETTATFSVPSTDNQVYDLTCSAGGKTSSPFYSVTVDDDYLASPTIAQSPASPITGGKVTLTCQTSVTGVTYAWTEGGTTIPGQGDKTIQYTSLTAGSSTISCSITKYSFVAEAATSTTLTVSNTMATPAITGTTSIGKWGRLELTCTSASETTGMTYVWTKNGADITGETSKIYSVASIAENNAGSYTCKTNFASLTEAESSAVTISVVAAGVSCTTDAECDGSLESLTGTCNTATSRCVCADSYYAAGSECANGSTNLIGSTLIMALLMAVSLMTYFLH